MRVGVYVDAYNLYYGMRDLCGRGTAGWRWLDIRAFASSFCQWPGSSVTRVVYCTAVVDQNDSPSAFADQDVYLKALRAHGSIDVLQLGRYVAWPKTAPLANKSANGRAELVVPTGSETWSPPSLPLFVKSPPASDPMILARVRMREEKGSDVNVATHLLADTFRRKIDAAIVVSNDSDLALPLSIARGLVPVGTLNPGARQLAGALRGNRGEGPGRHWWRGRLGLLDFANCQMPEVVGNRWRKPSDW